ncbi:MAG: hypothetical protein JW869_05070 [Candidatus Omnitrophica bacterium]|nr:hypothetical protein [Candidatus Omnitrophota bacterium]
MSLLAFILAGAVFAFLFALSLRNSTKGIKLFFAVIGTSVAAILTFLALFRAFEEVNPIVILVLLIVGVVAVLILTNIKFRLY